MLLSIKSSSWPNNGTFRRRSRHKCCLMSRLSPSGRSPTRDSSSTPRVAAQRWRSCCRTRSRSRGGSCLRRIHHSRSRMRSCISAFFAVIDCKKTWKSNHNTNRKKINYITSCNNLRGLRAHEHWTLNLLLVKIAETIPLHFTLEFEGPRKSEWMINLQGVSHAGMQCIMSHGLPDFCQLKDVARTENQETRTLQNLTTLEIFILCRRARSHMSLHYTWIPMSLIFNFNFHGTAFGCFKGPHNISV